MRLLNTSTGLFEEFIGTNIPAYAILSHTWGEEEVSFKDMTSEPSHTSKRGYAKISMTCQLAKADGIQYAWIDTCCIDKTSSAELSEAINSMYQWYQKAQKCYTYLVDLESTPAWRETLPLCRWFTRGWTLQELIAPPEVYFFDQNWNMMFQKIEGVEYLASITGIDRRILRDSRSLLSISVAQRMSWASRRTTTRVEDEAYCLLGIFEVNMPMLYGEGRKAFSRLQEEIVRICPDLSIFAWKSSSPQPNDGEGAVACSIFASAPGEFAQSGSYIAVNAHSTNDFFMSNQGIKIHTRMGLQGTHTDQGYQYVFPVCKTDDGIDQTIWGIRLRKCGASQLVRQDPWVLIEHDLSFPSMQSRTMYLLTRLPAEHFPKYLVRDIVLSTRSHILQVVLPPELFISNSWPWARFDVTDQVFFVSDNLGLDYAAARISGSIDVGTHKKRVDANFDFMLYTFGWANTQASSKKPGYTIVPWKPSDSILKDLNDKLEQYDYSTFMVESYLAAYEIVMSSGAEYELGDSGFSIEVHCESYLVSDQTKCLSKFWKLQLSSRMKKIRS